MLWCPLRFPHKTYVGFVFTSSCLREESCRIYVIRVCLRIVVSNTYCAVFLFCLASFMFPVSLDFPCLIVTSVFSNVYWGMNYNIYWILHEEETREDTKGVISNSKDKQFNDQKEKGHRTVEKTLPIKHNAHPTKKNQEATPNFTHLIMRSFLSCQTFQSFVDISMQYAYIL